MDLKLIARVLQGGPVIPFGHRPPKVPTLLIAGRKYALSTDGGDLGDRMEDELGNDRVIRNPDGPKWRYLWVYDTDRQRVFMWRVSDGDEKLEDSARGQAARIVKLEKKGQLNHVTHEEYRKVDTFMRDRYEDTLQALQRSVEENKSAFQRQVDVALNKLMESLRPKLEAQIESLAAGVHPLGWQAPTGLNERWTERSKVTYVMSRFFEQEFSLAQCEAYLAQEGLDVNEPGRDIQAAEWARFEIIDREYERYLPERP